MKTYRVKKSKYYKEEYKHLFRSYIFEYFAVQINKWVKCKNHSTMDYLKAVVLSDPLSFDNNISCDFTFGEGIK
jgi:hypothetical protein